MPRKKKKDDLIVIKPFDPTEFIPDVDPFVTEDDGSDIPVKLGKDDHFLPASGVPIDAAAMMGYLQYLVGILGPIEDWADLLNGAKTDFDDAVAAVLKDAIPMDEHQAEMDKRVLKTTRDRQVRDAEKNALQDATPNDEVDQMIDAAVQKATADMLTKDEAADQVTQALEGMVSEDEMKKAVAAVEAKMAKMVTKADAKKNQDAAVEAALESIEPAKLDLDIAVAAILEQTGLDVSSMVGSTPAKKVSRRKKPAKTAKAKTDSQAAAPAQPQKQKKTRSVSDWLNQKKK